MLGVHSLQGVQVPQDLQAFVLLGLWEKFVCFSNTQDKAPCPAQQTCIISRSFTESLICSRRRPPASPVTGHLEQHPGAQIQNQRAREYLLSQPTFSGCTKSCCSYHGKSGVQQCASWQLSAGPAVSHSCPHWVLLCTPANVPVQTWFSKCKMGMKASSPFPPVRSTSFGLVSACQGGPAILV